ncbi:unnamed protein product [Rhodiola kirilowii]
MRIRRSLTTPVSATTDSENDAALTSSDPADAFLTTPRRCSTTTASASSSSSLVCVLNQSPWDVADPSSQLEGGLFSLTGTSFVPELAKISQSLASSVKLSVDNDNRKQQQLDEGFQFDKLKYDKYSERGGNSMILNSSEGKIRAEKNNGSAALSSKSQIRSSSGKKPQPKQSTDSTPLPGMKRRGRPTKKPSSNPDEFYYYSGFGPHWGKKRDNIHKQPTPPRTAKTDELCSSEASSPRSMAEDDKGNDIEFVDYDDDDDDDENEDGRRPSVRKKVKARSLKSLM